MGLLARWLGVALVLGAGTWAAAESFGGIGWYGDPAPTGGGGASVYTPDGGYPTVTTLWSRVREGQTGSDVSFTTTNNQLEFVNHGSFFCTTANGSGTPSATLFFKMVDSTTGANETTTYSIAVNSNNNVHVSTSFTAWSTVSTSCNSSPGCGWILQWSATLGTANGGTICQYDGNDVWTTTIILE